MDKKKPLFIILVSEFPPGLHGGIGYWAKNVHTALNANGSRAIVMTRKTKIHKQLNLKSTETIKYISGRNWTKMSWLYLLPHLFPLLITGQNITIIAATWRNATMIHYLKKIFPFTLYCSARGSEITKTVYPAKSKTRSEFKRVLKNIDILIPISSFLDKLVRENFPEIPIKSVVIGNDVDHHLFSPVEGLKQKNELRTKIGIPENTPVLLTVGRMVTFKGFPDLIRALKPIAEEIPEFIFLMVSAPREPEYSKVLDTIRSSGLEKNVIIKNHVEHNKLPLLYQAADVFVLWSKAVYEPMYQEEGFGRTAIEAAACGLPVVVSDTGGQPETIIDGKTGYVVPSGEEELLAKRLISLLTDKSIAEKMGKAGRLFIEKTYTADIMREKILQLHAQ